MMSHDPENLFNEEIAQLLGSLEDGEEQNPSEDSMADLMSLFEDNFRENEASETQKSRTERITLSSLPSDAEIEDLFPDNDLNWDDDNSYVTMSELGFSENAEEIKAESVPQEMSTATDADWDELESLLQDSTPSPLISGRIAVFEALESVTPLFYWKELLSRSRTNQLTFCVIFGLRE